MKPYQAFRLAIYDPDAPACELIDAVSRVFKNNAHEHATARRAIQRFLGLCEARGGIDLYLGAFPVDPQTGEFIDGYYVVASAETEDD